MAVYQFSNKKNTKKRNISKIAGITLLVVCSLAFLCIFTNLIGFMKYFLLGTFGMFAYPMFIVLFVVGLALLNNKKYVMSKKYVVFLSLSIVFLLSIIQLAVVGVNPAMGYGEYLASNYHRQLTAGGMLIGFITSSFLYTIGQVGSFVVYSLGFIIFAALTADVLYFSLKKAKQVASVKVQIKEKPKKELLKEKATEDKTKEEVNVVLGGNLKEELTKEQEALERLGLVQPRIQGQTKTTSRKDPKPTNRREYILTPPQVDLDAYFAPGKKPIPIDPSTYEPLKPLFNASVSDTKREELNSKLEEIKKDEIKPSKVFHEENLYDNDINLRRRDRAEILPVSNEIPAADYADDLLKSIILESPKRETPEPEKREVISSPRGYEQIKMDSKPSEEQKASEPKEPKKQYVYTRPPVDLLTTESVDLSTMNEDVVEKRILLENALDTFGIPAKVIGVIVGPAVTRYELEMPPGISVKKVISHSDDIALALASNGDIRIEAPIPGKSAVGIEVPNNSIATVAIKDIISSKEFNASRSPLTFSLGKDINGQVKICNLQKMPHLLVAGSTGSGKSVCLNSIIISLIYKTSPEDLRIILIDPKRVEFSMYEGLPHLMMPTIVTDAQKAINAFNWAIDEMERRFVQLQDTKTRNIDEYNAHPKVLSGELEKMPFIVIIVDELADLMMMNKKEIEEKIMRLAQKARAAGIHLILATQRPSVDVITGTIKANLSSRIAFAVTSFADSSTILGQGGAEKLLGKGDMLYAPSDAAEPKRIQGCFVSGSEVDNIVGFVRDHNESVFDSEVARCINSPGKSASNMVDGETETNFDPLLPQALKLIIENGQASITMIQRKFFIGYPRAARIIDQMEEANFISASDGSKPRSVYITMEEYEGLFGDAK